MPQSVTPSLAHPQGAVIVRPAASRADRRRFLILPWRIYARDRRWVPPLLRDVRAVLAPSHPFHRHAEVQCFLAWRGSEVVGRVAAIVNRGHIEFHKEPAGFFGLFECDPIPMQRVCCRRPPPTSRASEGSKHCAVRSIFRPMRSWLRREYWSKDSTGRSAC